MTASLIQIIDIAKPKLYKWGSWKLWSESSNWLGHGIGLIFGWNSANLDLTQTWQPKNRWSISNPFYRHNNQNKAPPPGAGWSHHQPTPTTSNTATRKPPTQTNKNKPNPIEHTIQSTVHGQHNPTHQETKQTQAGKIKQNKQIKR